VKTPEAEFVKSAFEKKQWVTDSLPEVAFLGRSNVGKSSLINSLLQRKGLARTSNTPGRTQSINFFLIEGSFYFVDLPGYGFAKVSKAMRADWGEMAEEYLAGRRELALCIQLIDARREPTALDVQLNEWLVHHGKRHLVVATKSDKLSRNDLQRSIKTIKAKLPDADIVSYSASSGQGREELWAAIYRGINNLNKKQLSC
jgi:GTP-binding protein